MKPVYTPNRPMCEITQGFLFDTMDTMNYHNFTSRVRRYTKSLCDFIDAAAATGQIYHANDGALKREVVVKTPKARRPHPAFSLTHLPHLPQPLRCPHRAAA